MDKTSKLAGITGVIVIEEAWPTSLNPCPFRGEHGPRPHTACNWNVGGRVTQVCNNCVWHLEKKFAGIEPELARVGRTPREAALTTFTPDPHGAICQPD